MEKIQKRSLNVSMASDGNGNKVFSKYKKNDNAEQPFCGKPF